MNIIAATYPHFSVRNCVLLLLAILQLSIYSKIAYAQPVYAASETSGTYSCAAAILGGCGSGTVVTSPGNAVTTSLIDSAIISSTKSVLGLTSGGNTFLKLQFANPIPSQGTVYIKVGTPVSSGLVSGLLGILGLLGSNIYVDAYNNTTLFSASANNNLRMFRNPIGELFIVVTPAATGTYNSIRINVESPVVDLASSLQLPVYYAKFDTTTPSCSQNAIYTDLGSTTGVTLALSSAVANPSNAIDALESSYTTLTTGTLAVAGTVYQTIYFNGLSQSGDEVRVLLSTTVDLLRLGLLSSIKVQTYNGATANPVQAASDAILNLGLGGSLDSSNIIPVYFTSSTAFDRIVISCSNLIGLTLLTSAGTVNVYDVKRVPKRPTFTNPLSSTNYVCSGSPINLAVDAVPSGNQLNWYTASSGGTAFNTGPTYTTSALTINTTYWIATTKTNCTTSSVRIPLNVLINPLPSATIADTFYVCQSGSQFSLNYSNLVNSPISYRIGWSPEALTAHFSAINTTTLPASPIKIDMPNPRVAAGIYAGFFFLKNANTCEKSQPFLLNVQAAPIIHPSTTFQ